MEKILWKMPESASSIIRGPIFEVLPKRQCKISFSIEGEEGVEKWISLLFEGVESFKCTYLTSIYAIDTELRHKAYETLISSSKNPWYIKIKDSYIDYCASAKLTPKELTYLMIAFDDGPCFELICVSFQELNSTRQP